MRRVPKVSDSRRDGRELMSLATLSSWERTVDDTPGWKVEGAKICFMVSQCPGCEGWAGRERVFEQSTIHKSSIVFYNMVPYNTYTIPLYIGSSISYKVFMMVIPNTT